MTKQRNPIPVFDESSRFLQHVLIPNNKRIIFSAPYGSGKTHFLKSFFKIENIPFNEITINPIKYSVSSNRDIFELIKVDLIIQFFENGFLKAEKSNSDFQKVTPEWFIKDKFTTVASELVKLLPAVNPIPTGNMFFKFVEILPALKKEYEKYANEHKIELSTYEEKLVDYLLTKEGEMGHAFEQNQITQIIREILKRVKENTCKENVLIIDDFDRLDPEHVFRILNVLSVHNDSWDSDNKFGFDKIIIVCDIDRLEKLFKHKYGVDADFEGYMDKFCSTHYYRFSIENEILSYLSSKVVDSNTNNTKVEELYMQLQLLTVILTYFIKKKKITLRKVLKTNFQFSMPDKHFLTFRISNEVSQIPHMQTDNIYIANSDLLFLNTLKTLSMVWGDLSLFLKDIDWATNDSVKIKAHFDTSQIIKALKGIAISYHLAHNELGHNIIASKNSVSNDGSWGNPKVQILGIDFTVALGYSAGDPYTAKESVFSKVKIQPVTGRSYNMDSITFGNFFLVLKDIINRLNERHYLKDFDYT